MRPEATSPHAGPDRPGPPALIRVVEPIARRRRLGYGCPGPPRWPIGLAQPGAPRSGRGGRRFNPVSPTEDRVRSVCGSGPGPASGGLCAAHTAGHGRAGEEHRPWSPHARGLRRRSRRQRGRARRRRSPPRMPRTSPSRAPSGPGTPTAPVAAPTPAPVAGFRHRAHAGPDRGHPAGRPRRAEPVLEPAAPAEPRRRIARDRGPVACSPRS